MNKSYYDNPLNLETALWHYLSIFSESHEPVIPKICKIDGTTDVVKTLALSTYSGFPESEKQIWLNHFNG